MDDRREKLKEKYEMAKVRASQHLICPNEDTEHPKKGHKKKKLYTSNGKMLYQLKPLTKMEGLKNL